MICSVSGSEVEANIPSLLQICKDKSIPVSEPITLPRIIDTLIGHYIEPQCDYVGLGALQMALFEETTEAKLIQPTFIMNHPVAMSPLSKEHGNTGKSERFELFVNGVELVNAYTEQNDPVVQCCFL